MSIREFLNRIPPAVSIAIVVVIIVVAGIYVYMQVGPTSVPTVAPAKAGEMTTLKCNNCGYTFERETLELQKKYGLPNGRIVLTGDALQCPKCKRYTLTIPE